MVLELSLLVVGSNSGSILMKIPNWPWLSVYLWKNRGQDKKQRVAHLRVQVVVKHLPPMLHLLQWQVLMLRMIHEEVEALAGGLWQVPLQHRAAGGAHLVLP